LDVCRNASSESETTQARPATALQVIVAMDDGRRNPPLYEDANNV